MPRLLQCLSSSTFILGTSIIWVIFSLDILSHEPMLTLCSVFSTADTYVLNNYFVHQALNTVLLCFLFNPFSFIMYKGGKCLSAPESDRDCSSCVSCSCFKNVKNCQQLLVVSKMYQKMVFKPHASSRPPNYNDKLHRKT